MPGTGDDSIEINEGTPAPDVAAAEGEFVGSTPSAADTPAAETSDRDSLLTLLEEKLAPPEEPKTPEAHNPGEKPTEPEAKAPEKPAEPEPEPEPEPETEDTETEADETPLTDEERAAVPKTVQRKVSRLLRNVRRLKPDAEAFRNVTRYMAANNLTSEEAARGFEVMALIKRGDPRALDALKPYIESLNQITGAVLPPDVKDKVEQGYIDDDSARELARLRAEKQRAENERAAQEANRAEITRAGIRDALNSWEARFLASNDPDYLAVREAVSEFATATFAAKPPASAQEAVQRVEGFFRSLRGPRSQAASGVARPAQPTRPGPSSVASVPTQPAREPATMEEAIHLALRRVGAA